MTADKICKVQFPGIWIMRDSDVLFLYKNQTVKFAMHSLIFFLVMFFLWKWLPFFGTNGSSKNLGLFPSDRMFAYWVCKYKAFTCTWKWIYISVILIFFSKQIFFKFLSFIEFSMYFGKAECWNISNHSSYSLSHLLFWLR